ncbi:MAG: cell division protein FtsL [Methylococcaceae bacterium]|nr:cell division protein FtsL [Methylococcaceae bacterium]
MAPVILFLLLIGSAWGVVYQNNYCRDLFLEIQRLEMELENHEIESGQLLLEKTTLAGYSRIERAAKSKIGLVQPGRESIVYLKTPAIKDAQIDD